MFGFDYDGILREMREAVATLKERMDALEKRVESVEGELGEAIACARKAAENSQSIIDIMESAKGVAGFFKKHGPRMVAFATGLLAAAGIGNPEVLAFLQTFFG